MSQSVDWTIRLLVAALCGALIGFERSKLRKSAGIRTHMVVAIASALIMLVSKYGFYDILATTNIDLDPSRIAAQIVSGISFIGAGTILVRRSQISGLTTAAGVWATAAIGMSVGAGMYMISVIATLLIVLVQKYFHDDSLINSLMRSVRLRLHIEIEPSQADLDGLKNFFAEQGITDTSFNLLVINDKMIVLESDALVDHRFDTNQFLLRLKERPGVLMVQVSNMKE
ncbi:Mg2+ transporter [Ligilactobacillus acidipiscis DSM 15836]|jgi:putative Mg2+ transporter-C (MgtC) family protein|uniref:Mg2+ transporter n=1 Tax=Ligilactobacillus acidipiscis DSM 15836 TaxID=1423716 RepID=A0ABR5PJR5_9LACO|nr:MgtC/SapB family protein [Ligilactobacillus acidipiscis]KRM26562.1 Mg2+ transporter [Ligilactobacillus acidipiscis DSM 15836]MCI1924797.1 MgtC/SapB family protein [Ligilactobacillus acidipiscis]GAW63709.1 magnesium transporter MgtC [Ligilactobacillus acidipiscis]GEN20630.1 methyltransferase [Ligilactobacillus acidipiscis]